MTSSEVKEALSAFSDLAVDQFKYLKAFQNYHLQMVDNLELIGDSLISLCGGGSLYIVEPPYSNEFEDHPNNDHKANLIHSPILFVENNSVTFDPAPVYGQSELVKYSVPE
uniref:Uncharacterized protein n=1 Tax=Amphimedon queenslandica TaxID=400682 RepID=A0A1X7SN19_AMPQE